MRNVYWISSHYQGDELTMLDIFHVKMQRGHEDSHRLRAFVVQELHDLNTEIWSSDVLQLWPECAFCNSIFSLIWYKRLCCDFKTNTYGSKGWIMYIIHESVVKWLKVTLHTLCTDCKILYGKFIICDVGLYKINWCKQRDVNNAT